MKKDLKNYVNCHWFSGSYSSYLLPVLRRGIESFYRENFMMSISWITGSGMNGYQSSLRHDDKIVLLFDENKDYAKRVHNDRFSVIFHGEFFDSLPFEKLSDFARLVSFVTVTRFDQYYQDTNRHIDVSGVFQAFKRGCCRGFRAYRHLEGGSTGCKKGETLELGRRGSSGSGKFLRIYDKELESDGKIKGVRWEVEWTGKRAVSAWRMWADSGFSAASCVGFIFSTVDWVEPTKDQHKGRWKRLAWYDLLVDSADTTLSVPVELAPTSAAKKDKWIRNSVSSSLVYMRLFCTYVWGDNYFEQTFADWMQTGTAKLSKSTLVRLRHDISKHSEMPDFVGIPSIEDLQRLSRRSA